MLASETLLDNPSAPTSRGRLIASSVLSISSMKSAVSSSTISMSSSTKEEDSSLIEQQEELLGKDKTCCISGRRPLNATGMGRTPGWNAVITVQDIDGLRTGGLVVLENIRQ